MSEDKTTLALKDLTRVVLSFNAGLRSGGKCLLCAAPEALSHNESCPIQSFRAPVEAALFAMNPEQAAAVLEPTPASDALAALQAETDQEVAMAAGDGAVTMAYHKALLAGGMPLQPAVMLTQQYLVLLMQHHHE